MKLKIWFAAFVTVFIQLLVGWVLQQAWVSIYASIVYTDNLSDPIIAGSMFLLLQAIVYALVYTTISVTFILMFVRKSKSLYKFFLISMLLHFFVLLLMNNQAFKTFDDAVYILSNIAVSMFVIILEIYMSYLIAKYYIFKEKVSDLEVKMGKIGASSGFKNSMKKSTSTKTISKASSKSVKKPLVKAAVKK